jgi:hypothetical protein
MIWLVVRLTTNKDHGVTGARRILQISFALMLLAPCSFFLTFLLFPLWRQIEESFDLEAVGHASIAGWCFFATYLGCLMVLLAVRLLIKKS